MFARMYKVNIDKISNNTQNYPRSQQNATTCAFVVQLCYIKVNTGSLFHSVLLTPSNRCHIRLSSSRVHTYRHTMHVQKPKMQQKWAISLTIVYVWPERGKNDAHYYLFTASFMLIMWNGNSFIACILFEPKNVLLFTYFVDSIFRVSIYRCVCVCGELVFRFHFGQPCTYITDRPHIVAQISKWPFHQHAEHFHLYAENIISK